MDEITTIWAQKNTYLVTPSTDDPEAVLWPSASEEEKEQETAREHTNLHLCAKSTVHTVRPSLACM